MREIAVIGEKNQAFRIKVESSDRMHPRLFGHEIDNRHPVVSVLGGGNDVVRLVEQVVHEVGAHANLYAINRHLVDIHVHASSKFGYDTIDGDSTRSDDVFTHPPTTKTPLCEHFLQALASVVVFGMRQLRVV
jgi:hypothetical protein